MGYMRHHAIVCTFWNAIPAAEAHIKATELFGEGTALGNIVSPVMLSSVQAYASFFIGPDGSKENWEHDIAGDEARASFISYLRETWPEQCDWALIQYGDDNGISKIVDHSDNENPEN